MALFFYHAFTKKGKKTKGYIDAPTMANAKQKLSGQGLYPTAISSVKQEARQGWFAQIFARKVSVKEKILFTKQLAVLLKSGVPLLQAVELLIDQFEGKLQSILITVKDNLKEGMSFWQALSEYPKVFNTIYVQLVRAGEARGSLEMILERLTSYIERREEIRKKVRGAMTYPIIQIVVSLTVVVFLLWKVVPAMVQQFMAVGAELPMPTRIVLALSNFIQSYFLFMILFVVLLYFAYRYFQSTAQGAYTIDKIRLKIPLFGYFTRLNALVQFCYTLGILLQGGVNLSESLDIVIKVIDNRVLAEALAKARDKIIKQGRISEYLKQTGMFPPIAIYLIKTGEESGQLDTMLLTVAQNYEEDLKEIADSLVSLIGPILLVVMGVSIGFIVLAIALPMMKLAGAISKIR